MSVKEINIKPQIDSPSPESKFENNTLSVIIRCHKEEGLPFLDEALFSLAIQYWQDLEVIVALQNGSGKFKYEVEKLIAKQPFQKSCKFQVLTVEIPVGADGRSVLINRGIERAVGRYLAFLDYDDVVYQHGYKTLIEQLAGGEASIAAGGCHTAKVKKDFGNRYIQIKETPFIWGRNRYDLFRDNFLPIHSYVIDRLRINEFDLYFDETLSLLEDYDFLLRLSAKYDFDFSKLDVFVCEYRLHDSNSMPNSDASPELLERYARAFQSIKNRKTDIHCKVPISDLIDLLAVEATALEIQANTLNASNQELIESVNITTSANPQIIREVVDKGYEFFSRYPRLEKGLSKTVHLGWRVFSKFSSAKPNGNQD